jgi:hypothetical protein
MTRRLTTIFLMLTILIGLTSPSVRAQDSNHLLAASFGNWFTYLRQVLELLYYLSGVAIAFAAFWGLKQLTISKKIARENATREAYKLAADNCRYFAREVVPLQKPLFTQIMEKGIKSFQDRHFLLEYGEIKNHNFDLELLKKEIPSIDHELVSFLNAMEAFALFFASGVAAEEVGYRETGTTFCHAVEYLMPALFSWRSVNVRFDSTFKLYEIWRDRQKAENISTQMKALENDAKRLSKETIKPIGA